MSPNSNQLTFVYQIPTYHATMKDLLNSVAAGLAGWVAGPFLFIPFVAVVGRSSIILWSLVAIFACQVWGAEMTGVDDYIPFTMSRLIAGLFGGIPAILGSGYIIDMFFLHQRGKAFAVFEVLIIFAVVGGGTLGGFIVEKNPWPYAFWWTLGPVGASIIAVFLFVEETGYDRDAATPSRAPLPKNWIANRIATFLPGTRTQGQNKGKELVSTPTRRKGLDLTVHRSAAQSRLSRSPSHPSLSSQEPTSSSRSVFPSCKPPHSQHTSSHQLKPAATGSPRCKWPSSPSPHG